MFIAYLGNQIGHEILSPALSRETINKTSTAVTFEYVILLYNDSRVIYVRYKSLDCSGFDHYKGEWPKSISEMSVCVCVCVGGRKQSTTFSLACNT